MPMHATILASFKAEVEMSVEAVKDGYGVELTLSDSEGEVDNALVLRMGKKRAVELARELLHASGS